MKTIFITGGAGFIGSHVVRRFVLQHPEFRIVNIDKLTYAGNLANLKDIENKENYIFKRETLTIPSLFRSSLRNTVRKALFIWLQNPM